MATPKLERKSQYFEPEEHNNRMRQKTVPISADISPAIKDQMEKPDLLNQSYSSNKSEAEKKEAWLSAETTIEEINVNQHYFVMSGYLTVFWQDLGFKDWKKIFGIWRYGMPPDSGKLSAVYFRKTIILF